MSIEIFYASFYSGAIAAIVFTRAQVNKRFSPFYEGARSMKLVHVSNDLKIIFRRLKAEMREWDEKKIEL